MPRIRIKNGPAKGQTFEIADKPIVVGREPSCSLQILDKGASRQHAEVFRIGEMCFIRDLQSRNGTYVNDTKVDEELLREGDRIQIGATVIIFESVGEEQDLGVEYSAEGEENFGQTLTLRLEDLSSMNVSLADSDGGEGLRLRAVYHLSRLLAEERDVESLIEKALEFCCSQCGADSAYLFLPDPQKGGSIVPRGAHTQSGRKGSKVSRSIIRRSLQEKRAVLTTDAMQDARFAARDSIMLKQIHSVICAPLSARDEATGVLYLASDQVQEVFTEDDLELVAAMAEMFGLAIDNHRIQREQRETLLSTIKVLVRASEMRDPTTRGHNERVATYATGIAIQLRLAESVRDSIQLAALLHDLGKLAVDDGSLFRLGKEVNADVEQKRIDATLELIDGMRSSPDVRDAIQYQNERYDGSGPLNMSGGDIPVSAQVLAVAHEFDVHANVVSEERPEELIRRAIVDIGKQGEKQFSPDVVKALLIAHRNGLLYSQKPEVSTESVIVDPREAKAQTKTQTKTPPEPAAPAQEGD